MSIEDTVSNLQDKLFYRPRIQLDCKMIQKLVEEGAFIESPLVVGDVGVGLGFDRSWDIFADQCLQIGFEPNKKNCFSIETEYLKRKYKRLPRERVENVALWDSVGTKTLYITKDCNAASCYPPNEAFFQRLPDKSPMEVIDTLEIKTTTLDNYHKEKGDNFDVLKLDVQGGELPILKGAIGQLRSSVIAVIAEVEFVELYLGQPLFAEIDQFMRSQGFNLFDLDIRRWQRKHLPDTFSRIRMGQTIWADALYLKDPVEYDNIFRDSDSKYMRLLKLAALAEYFSLPDYAMEILSVARNLSLIEKSEEERLINILNKNIIISRRYRDEPCAGS